MLMAHLSSKRQNIGCNFYNTPIPLIFTYSSQQRTITGMDLYLFRHPYYTWTRQHITWNIYRKPIHRNQYLHWENHHNLSAKYSVLKTLTHIARMVCANPQLLQKEEEEHIKRPFQSASSPNGPPLDSISKTTTGITPTTKTTNKKLKRTTVSISWYHTPRS